MNQDNEMLAGQLPVIEELEEARNELIEDCERLAEENQELQTLIEHTSIQLDTVSKSEEYLKQVNENHITARRRLESKIMELQQEYQVMRSTHSRLLNVS